MLKNPAYIIVAFVFVAACGSAGGSSLASNLGTDFAKAFNQSKFDEPLDASELTLAMMPFAEPFNP